MDSKLDGIKHGDSRIAESCGEAQPEWTNIEIAKSEAPESRLPERIRNDWPSNAFKHTREIYEQTHQRSPMVCVSPWYRVNHPMCTNGDRKAQTFNDLAKVANCRLRQPSRSNCNVARSTSGMYRDLILISHPRRHRQIWIARRDQSQNRRVKFSAKFFMSA